ncbi:MAG: GWxTD domain-containing protein [Candidatus Krumholzibacteriota bacterium]|nr:GWxTD domain-containing protein [Candidatus Krumholzibacteriota bacterium]
MRPKAGIVLISLLVLLWISRAVPVRTSPYQVFDEEKLYQRLAHREKIYYLSLRYLLNEYQKKQYLTLPDRKSRNEWIDRFWLVLDPTPTTKKNERKIEHEERVKQAKVLFPSAQPPGWDDRGEIFIRFGPPFSRERTWAHIGRFEQRMPGEVWHYRNPEMLVSFTDRQLCGQYTHNYVPGGEESWTEFYNDCNFGKTARMILEEMQNPYSVGKLLPQHIDSQLTDSRNMLNPDAIDYIQCGDLRKDLYPVLTKHVGDEYRLADRALANFHKHNQRSDFFHFPELDLSMTAYFDITCFRGGPGKIRTEINFEVPVSELSFRAAPGCRQAELELRVAVWTLELEKVASAEETLGLTVRDGKEYLLPHYIPGQVVVTLPPGYYRFGIETVDMNSQKRGVFRVSTCISPLDDKLALSNIQFARLIGETEKLCRFMKGNLIVIPHPLHLYRKKTNLKFYFEIYGLKLDREDFALYRVEYSIAPRGKIRQGPLLKDSGTVVSSKIGASGFGPRQPVYLEIATEDLRGGPFQLKVRVTDRRTLETVEETANFAIYE